MQSRTCASKADTGSGRATDCDDVGSLLRGVLVPTALSSAIPQNVPRSPDGGCSVLVSLRSGGRNVRVDDRIEPHMLGHCGIECRPRVGTTHALGGARRRCGLTSAAGCIPRYGPSTWRAVTGRVARQATPPHRRHLIAPASAPTHVGGGGLQRVRLRGNRLPLKRCCHRKGRSLEGSERDIYNCFVERLRHKPMAAFSSAPGRPCGASVPEERYCGGALVRKGGPIKALALSSGMGERKPGMLKETMYAWGMHLSGDSWGGLRSSPYRLPLAGRSRSGKIAHRTAL